MDELFNNYNAFYNMVLATTIMSNTQTKEFITDCKAIIDFIGKAYQLSADLIKKATTIILDDLIKLGRTTDKQAVYNSRSFDNQYSVSDTLFDIKGDVLTTIENIGRNETHYINSGWFDYSHYRTYQANVRYAKIIATAATGNLIATRQTGLLSALGIGCPLNYEFSIMRLTQCVFWGDIPAMYYLAYVYQLTNDTIKAKLFYEVADLANQYLLAGYTVLPEKVKGKYSEAARIYYVYISSILQDIVFTLKKERIDFSFIEAITSEKIDYFQRMNFINNYNQQKWKDITNSSERPSQRIGFR